MVLAKAFAVGIVTGLLAPVVAAVVQVVAALVAGVFVGSFAVTGGGGSFGIAVPMSFGPPDVLLRQFVVGFAVGFLFMLWRALVKRETRVER